MEKTYFLNLLDQNTEEVLALVKTCSADQLRFKQDGQWSMLEILEHIIIVDKLCAALLLKPSNETATDLNLYGKAKLNKILVEGRTRKVQAADILKPKGAIENISLFEKVFLAERNLLKENIENKKIIIDNKTHKHPLLGAMTIADWLHFIPCHTERHLEQIKDLLVMAKTD